MLLQGQQFLLQISAFVDRQVMVTRATVVVQGAALDAGGTFEHRGRYMRWCSNLQLFIVDLLLLLHSADFAHQRLQSCIVDATRGYLLRQSVIILRVIRVRALKAISCCAR